MGINFPNTPTIGQLWPQPAVVGVPVYRWDGQAWMTGSADIIGAVRFDAAQTLTAPQQAQARTNIVTAKSAANSDITSLTGLTTPLSAAQGGTGDAGTAWTAYTPTVSITGGAGTATGRYKQIGKTLFINATLVVTTGGTGASITLPPGMIAGPATCYLFGREFATTGFLFVGVVGGSQSGVTPIRYDNISAVTTGWQITLNGVLEIA